MKRNLIKIIMSVAVIALFSYGTILTTPQVQGQGVYNPVVPGGLHQSPQQAAQQAAEAIRKPSVNDKEDSTFTGRLIAKAMAWIANIYLMGAAIILRIAGTFLSVSMLLTLHISEIVNNNSSIGLIWRTVRDFSSIFFIFMLLYASIRMILGLDGGSFKKLVINIVLCGLFINFSLFMTKVIVDASNVVALAFYNAIAPGETVNSSDPTRYFKMALNDNGISQIFMKSLKVQTIYDTRGQLQGDNVHMKIIVAGYAGGTLMIIAALNFVAAAAMFIIRIGILILLMTFSPIYFLGMVIPQLNSYSKKWMDTLIGQAIFAPIYLILVYVAVKILTNPSFMSFMGSSDQGSTFSNALIGTGTVGVFFQYGLTIMFLTTALVVAKSFAGEAAQYGDKARDLFKKGLKSATYDNFAGRRVIGGSASYLNDKYSNTKFGNSRMGRSIGSMTIAKAAGGKYGDMSFKDSKSKEREVAAKAREIDRGNKFERAISGNFVDVKNSMKDLSGGQKSKLGFSKLTNLNVLKNLKKSDFEAIYKRKDSKDDDALTSEQIDKIKDARIAALKDAIDKGEKDAVKNIVSNMTGEDLASLDRDDKVTWDTPEAKIDVNKRDLLKEKTVIEHLTTSQLKAMEDMDMETKAVIAEGIVNYVGPSGKPHTALGHIDKNEKLWLA